MDDFTVRVFPLSTTGRMHTSFGHARFETSQEACEQLAKSTQPNSVASVCKTNVVRWSCLRKIENTRVPSFLLQFRLFRCGNFLPQSSKFCCANKPQGLNRLLGIFMLGKTELRIFMLGKNKMWILMLGKTVLRILLFGKTEMWRRRRSLQL